MDYWKGMWLLMKKSLLLVLALFTFSCSRSILPKSPSPENQVLRHRYVLLKDAALRQDSATNSPVLQLLTSGDSIATLGKPVVLNGWNTVEYRQYLGYVFSPSLFSAEGEKQTRERKLGLFSHSLGNGFGLGAGFGSATALQMDFFYKRNRHQFHAGFAYQFNGQQGKRVTEQLANYGTTVIGRDRYFFVFTTGYDFWLSSRVAIGIDGSVGADNYFTNYSDKRFDGDGYHLVYDSPFVAGYGGKLHYLPTRFLLLSAGYNTLLGVNLSLSIVTFGSNTR